jgi:signal transduction histidine kinase
MPVSQDAFNLTELSKDILGSLGSLVHTKKLYLSLDAPSEVWVKTDRLRLRQVLVNLVGNAIKFTDRGGVTVRVKPESPGNDVQIEVSDTGTGIRREDLPKLFSEFTHLETAPAEKRGAGLGLAICKKIMRLLGGSVAVESEWGLGSTFRLALPAGIPSMRSIPPIQPAVLN